MTEQEIATYVETYINSITSSAEGLCWCYFLAGILFCIILFELLTFIRDSVCTIIDCCKKKQDKKLGKDKKNKEKTDEK